MSDQEEKPEILWFDVFRGIEAGLGETLGDVLKCTRRWAQDDPDKIELPAEPHPRMAALRTRIADTSHVLQVVGGLRAQAEATLAVTKECSGSLNRCLTRDRAELAKIEREINDSLAGG